MPSYLNIIKRHKNAGAKIISGTLIAEGLNLEAIQVRKDLAVTGIIGTPRIGYDICELIDSIKQFLNWSTASQGILVGTGNFGSALIWPCFKKVNRLFKPSFRILYSRVVRLDFYNYLSNVFSSDCKTPQYIRGGQHAVIFSLLCLLGMRFIHA